MRYLSIQEAAVVAGKTPRMIRYWISKGKLAAEQNESGRYRVTPRALKTAMAGTWRPVR